MSDTYASHTHQLPRSMVTVVRAPAGDPRLLTWTGRPGIQLLDFAAHQRFDRESLHRFPQERDASIAWAAAPPGLVLHTGPDSEQPVHDYLREDGTVVILWGSLALPGVLLSAAEARSRVLDLLATGGLFWLYRPDAGTLLERNYLEDRVTVARIPAS